MGSHETGLPATRIKPHAYRWFAMPVGVLHMLDVEGDEMRHGLGLGLSHLFQEQAVVRRLAEMRAGFAALWIPLDAPGAARGRNQSSRRCSAGKPGDPQGQRFQLVN